jgi:hypothetical protein
LAAIVIPNVIIACLIVLLNSASSFYPYHSPSGHNVFNLNAVHSFLIIFFLEILNIWETPILSLPPNLIAPGTSFPRIEYRDLVRYSWIVTEFSESIALNRNDRAIQLIFVPVGFNSV